MAKSNLKVADEGAAREIAAGVSRFSPILENTLESVEAYAREKPWEFGLWMLGIGFVLGWKLKPW
jgi:hypothetical protein